MKVLIYDESEKEKGKKDKKPIPKSKVKDEDDGEKEEVEIEIVPGDFNRVIDGTYDKGIFTWTENRKWGPFTLKGKERNMDILFNKTVRLPIGPKNATVNCAKAVFDGMNFVQIGWGNLSTISSEERQLSRANLIRDYENMELSDNKKITAPEGSLMHNLLPWLLLFAVIGSIISNAYNAATIKDEEKPMLMNFSIMQQQNGAMLKFLMSNATITSKAKT